MRFGARNAALTPVLIALAASAGTAAPAEVQPVCGGDFWASAAPAAAGAKRKASAPQADQRSRAAAPQAAAKRWEPVYSSPGLETFSGRQRELVAARGVVWSIDVTGSGASQRQAVAALLKAGAAAGWPGPGGTVFFRAKKGEQEKIAAAASRSFAPAFAAKAPPPPDDRPETTKASPAPPRPAAALTVRSALARVATELSAADLIAGWPTGVVVLPVRGGQLVRAGSGDEAEIRRDLSARTARWEVVAKAPVAAGSELASAAAACRPGAAAGRVASPRVKSAAGGMAVVDVEGQSLLIQRGELLLVVPDRVTPAASIALMRLE